MRRLARIALVLVLGWSCADLAPNADALDLAQPPDPPRASLITVSAPDASGTVAVTGAAGAVPGGRPVLALNLRTGHYVTTTSGPDGSFTIHLTAPAGSFISVRWDPFGNSFSPQAFQEPTGVLLRQTPSTILFVRPADGPAGTTAFGDVGVFAKGKAAFFQVQGAVSTLTTAPGGQVTVAGTLRITSPGISANFDAASFTVNANVSLNRVFDEAGRQQQVKYQFMSRLLTPTGLPVERFFPGLPPLGTGLPVSTFTLVAPGTIQATFQTTVPVPSSLSLGWYSPIITINPSNLPNPDATTSGQFPGVEQKFFGPNQARLPLLKVGAAGAPRLVWTLLHDTPSNGNRGVVAQEDRATFGITSRVIHNSDTYIVTRDDPRTGQRIAYRLEPYVPMLTPADREPIAPSIPLAFPGGVLTVSVAQPDGTAVSLGTASILQPRSSAPVTTDGLVVDAGGGGSIGELYQLTTLSDQSNFRFGQYGRHVVTMSGTIQDIWGNTYTASGTYEVFVARPLEMSYGAFPTTPFSVGDTLAPVVTVTPPVPAEVTVRLRLASNGNAATTTDRRVTGRANGFGYFHPGGLTRLTLDQPGEYRVDVTAQYTDPQGVLWMGSRTWGSVVETPNGMLIAHGRRGIDETSTIGQQWFTRASTGIPIGGNHVQYPFNSGDIMWASDFGNGQTDAATAVIAAQDTSGAVAGIVQTRGQGVPFAPPGDLTERIIAGEMPLFTSTPTGVNAAFDPAQIDQWGYTYCSAERPDVSVREIVSEDFIPAPYWRFDEAYAVQAGVGVNGDLQNEIKFQFGGVVFRTNAINQFAGYGSLFVLLPASDPLGTRIFPPFQGNGGGPTGGPIMTLKGHPIDLFIVPGGVTPGAVLTVGDTFSFSGQVGPPLASRVDVTITDPTGTTRGISGRANKVGYFYQPDGDFVVAQPGLYTVRVTVTHDGTTSAGQVTAPFPTGTVLGSDDGTFQVYVVPRGGPALSVDVVRDRFVTAGGAVSVTGTVPAGLQDVVVNASASMPGFLFQQGRVTAPSGQFQFTFDPVAVSRDFPNLDVRDLRGRPVSVDLVTLSFLLTGRSATGAATIAASKIYLRGDELLNLPAGTGGVFATIATDRDSYRTGDPLQLSVAASTGSVARTVDVYVSVLLPDNQTTVYLVGGGGTGSPTPLASGVVLPAGLAAGPVTILSLPLPAAPGGVYTWTLTLTEPGNPSAVIATGNAAMTVQP